MSGPGTPSSADALTRQARSAVAQLARVQLADAAWWAANATVGELLEAVDSGNYSRLAATTARLEALLPPSRGGGTVAAGPTVGHVPATPVADAAVTAACAPAAPSPPPAAPPTPSGPAQRSSSGSRVIALAVIGAVALIAVVALFATRSGPPAGPPPTTPPATGNGGSRISDTLGVLLVAVGVVAVLVVLVIALRQRARPAPAPPAPRPVVAPPPRPTFRLPSATELELINHAVHRLDVVLGGPT